MSSGLQDSPCFAVARCAVGKEHRAELATNEIEGRIFKRQRQSIHLAPFDPSVGRLSRRGVVNHRLVEVGYDIACAPGQSWRQGAGDNPTARGGFQNGAWRHGSCASCNIGGVRLENQGHHITVVVFRNRPGEHLISFQHGLSPVAPFDGSHDYHMIVCSGSFTPWSAGQDCCGTSVLHRKPTLMLKAEKCSDGSKCEVVSADRCPLLTRSRPNRGHHTTSATGNHA